MREDQCSVCLREKRDKGAVADPGFWIRGVKFQKFRPKPLILCHITASLHFMKLEICESRTPTLVALSMISLEIDLVTFTITYLIIQQLFI